MNIGRECLKMKYCWGYLDVIKRKKQEGEMITLVAL